MKATRHYISAVPTNMKFYSIQTDTFICLYSNWIFIIDSPAKTSRSCNASYHTPHTFNLCCSCQSNLFLYKCLQRMRDHRAFLSHYSDGLGQVNHRKCQLTRIGLDWERDEGSTLARTSSSDIQTCIFGMFLTRDRFDMHPHSSLTGAFVLQPCRMS